MTGRIDDIRAELDTITRVIQTHDTALVDTRLARGRLWRELCDWSEDAFPEVADALGVDLTVAKSERWLAGVYDAPINDWLDWTAHRDLATLDEPTRAALIDEAEAAGQATSAHVRRLAREEKARRRGAGADSPDADPITAATRAAYFVARFEEVLGVDFHPDTIALIAATAERIAQEWEAAGAATIASVFGGVPVAVEA